MKRPLFKAGKTKRSFGNVLFQPLRPPLVFLRPALKPAFRQWLIEAVEQGSTP
ncbi:hypothetical protein Rleg4DRAFT_3889 [Rhizobium leguminosarum bv. trifolii WSM2297]|uniref:Uncharacterized protein n=1 Tax=Rhizobium leguminosarum bv. trifolii WSM2297 TaxID=754762 RepID=J0WAD9_RHILT|nr:hypothetical protein Rleg4DRAFT_3889 [Rhizobium leguminosarum bv. trifolii WSM2297]